MTHVARFDIYYTQFLDHNAELGRELPAAFRDPKDLIPLYQAMVRTRLFDKKAIALQRTGQLGTFASCLGQEAIGVAVGGMMRTEDVLLSSYRDYGAQFLRGVRMLDILLYWGGDERGMSYPSAPRHDFPICVPVGSQTCHAVGVALAMQYRKEARVAVCILGDGATSKGDFYESINIAGVWRLPVVFVINNNQWAISVSRSTQSAAETLAQKAIAAGIRGEQVDGNDVIAVSYAVSNAIDSARHGGGASIIEALSYRLGDHTTADDARRYRSEEEVKRQRQYDPIERVRKYLVHSGCWGEEEETQLQQRCTTEVETAVSQYLDTPPQAPETMFDFLYATLPAALAEQRQEVRGDV
ncbi:MAG: pyruvate dehydrogenase (acetyl-transferring) E1 component subunit alpha [Gammaproteobacteria bacterium]